MSLYKLLFYNIDPETKIIHGLSRKLFIDALSSLINTSGTNVMTQSLGKLYTASTNNINISNVEGCNSINISNIIQSASSVANLSDDLNSNFNQILSSESNNISGKISSNVDKTISNITYEQIKSYNPYYFNKLNKILKSQLNNLSSDIEKIFEIYSVACDSDVYTLSSITNICNNTSNNQQNMYAFNRLLINLLNINNMQFYITDDDSLNVNETLSTEINKGSNCIIDSLAKNNINISNFKCNQSGDIIIKDVSQQAVSSINNSCIFSESTTKLLANNVYNKFKNRYDSIFDYINNLGLIDEQLTKALNMLDVIIGSSVEKIISAAGMMKILIEPDETISPTSDTSPQTSGTSPQTSGTSPQIGNTPSQISNTKSNSSKLNTDTYTTKSENESVAASAIVNTGAMKSDRDNSTNSNTDYSNTYDNSNNYTEADIIKQPETFMDKIKNNYIWIIVCCVICLILLIIILFFVLRKKDVPENNNNDNNLLI